jgi:hypothetical protein
MSDHQELWKDVPGYEGLYQVSSCGRIMRGGRIRKPKKDHAGYLVVAFCKNGIEKEWKVHRLVALAFLRNPERKRVVNHIDGDKQNNWVENLEWATHSENIRHAYKTGLRIVTEKQRELFRTGRPELSKPVFCKKDGITRTFESVREAARFVCGSSSAIAQCCNGRRKTHKGYIWGYYLGGRDD